MLKRAFLLKSPSAKQTWAGYVLNSVIVTGYVLNSVIVGEQISAESCTNITHYL